MTTAAPPSPAQVPTASAADSTSLPDQGFDPTVSAAAEAAPDAPASRPVDKQRATSDIGPLRSLVVAVPLFGLLYLAAHTMPDDISRLLLERGWIPYVIMVLSCWSVSILLLKAIGMRLQRRAFDQEVLPVDQPCIGPANVGQVIEHVAGLRAVTGSRHLGRSFLVDRVLRIVEHYAARRDVTETATVHNADAEADAAAVASSFSMVKVLVWAIPILGFIGTVIGIGAAVGGFSESLDGAEQLDAIKSSLGDVTSGLAVAFDTTLVALVASILVMVPTSWMQKSEEQLISDVDDYCVTKVLRRLVSAEERGEVTQGRPEAAVDAIAHAIVDVIAKPMGDMLAANAQLMTRLTESHEALSATQGALQDQLSGFTAASEKLGPNVEQAVVQLEKATTLAERATRDIGPNVERVVTRLEQASEVASVTTEQIGPGVTQAAAELAKATRLAEEATSSMGCTQDQLGRELGASRQLLQLLAAGLRASPAAGPHEGAVASQGNGSNGSSSPRG